MILKLPKAFWADHLDRCAGHPGVKRVIKQTTREVTVELDPVSLKDLESDAAYYAGPDGPDQLPPGLKQSAQAVLVRIRKAIYN